MPKVNLFAEQLRRAADWLEKNPSIVCYGVYPRGGSFIVYCDWEPFRKTFAGTAATRKRDGSQLRYTVEKDGITLEACEWSPVTPVGDAEEVTIQ